MSIKSEAKLPEILIAEDRSPEKIETKEEWSEDCKPGRIDWWGTNVQKRTFLEGELVLSKYCGNSKEKEIESS